MGKGQAQMDYIIAISIIFLVMVFMVNFTTSYVSTIKDSSDAAIIRSQTYYLLGMLERGPEPANWTQDTSAPLRRMGLRTDAYRFTVELRNEKGYYSDNNRHPQNLANETVYINFSRIYPGADMGSVTIYYNGSEIRYARQDKLVYFNTSVPAHQNRSYNVYFTAGTNITEKNTTLAGDDELTEVIFPVEKIDLLGYENLYSLNQSSVENIINSTGFDREFELVLNDADSNATYWRYGGPVPRRADIHATQRYMLYQNESGGIRPGQFIVKLW
jgi:hypothetical protein